MPLRNAVVIGGSYVGTNVAEQLAAAARDRYRVILIEKNSHFQHLFAFPRFAVSSNVNTHKAFIPYTAGRYGKDGAVLQAVVTGLTKSAVRLDRKVLLDGQHRDTIPYAYLAITTGTKLTPPSSLPGSEKKDGVSYLRDHVDKVKNSKRIVIIGAGAVGVQTATDIKELYPEKSVTLVHSRKNVMSKFHTDFHDIVAERCKELGVELALGSRVRLPKEGYPTDGRTFDVELMDGRKIPADFAIVATGQVPQSSILASLAPNSIDDSGFIKVLRTLQISNQNFPNVFALGDVADTGAHKAARPAAKQAEIVTKNIGHLVDEEPLEEYEVTDPAAIHMSLGIEKNLVFRDPVEGSTEPFVKHRDDGTLDMNIDGVWERRGGGPDAML